MEERRTASRLTACIPAYLDSTEDKHDLALIRDVSRTGARLLTRTKLPIGLYVHVELYVHGDAGTPCEAKGHVVRSDQRDIALSDVWPWEVAVEFESPLQDADSEIQALSERQLAMGIIKPPSERPPDESRDASPDADSPHEAVKTTARE